MNESLSKMVSALRNPAGVVVAARVAGLQGSEGGLIPGDLIISANGEAVPNVEALRTVLGKIQPGSPAVLQIRREEHLQFIVVELP